MRYVLLIGAMILCSACGHTSDIQSEEIQYKRVEYFETVFQPAAQACSAAGGFLILEDPGRYNARHARLSYGDMRKAVMRGCAGI